MTFKKQLKQIRERKKEMFMQQQLLTQNQNNLNIPGQTVNQVFNQ